LIGLLLIIRCAYGGHCQAIRRGRTAAGAWNYWNESLKILNFFWRRLGFAVRNYKFYEKHQKSEINKV
jgi:hypothetical protein